MGEEKVNLQDLARKIDELVNVLNVISGDLADVAKSLKNVTKPASTPSVSAPAAAPAKKGSINEIKQAFSPDLVAMLLFDEREKIFIVKPRRFLGSDNFAKIAAVVRELGGEYVSAGKNSHFKIPK